MARSPGSRFMKLAGMTASIASKAVSSGIKSINASEEEKLAQKSKLYTEIGLQIAQTLGEMKGAVMKVGQMLSQFQDILPPEITQAIVKLQREAPPMAFPLIEKQITKELGKPLDELFSSFNQTPFAAASIGQVHRAVLKDGTPVVVKVQYPGVDESCNSDLKQIRLALRLAGIIKIDKQLQDDLFDEIANGLHAELDYTIEAHNLNVFSSFHAKLDKKIIIPKPIMALTSRRVLTLTEEMGDSIEAVDNYPLAIRNEIAQRVFHMLNQQIFKLHCFHCDPHPGNFACRPDGSVIVYDFGGIKELSPAIANTFKQIMRAALEQDVALLEDALRTLEIRNHVGQIPAHFYLEWMDTLAAPVLSKIDSAELRVHIDIMHLIKKSFKYIDSFQPSPHTMMINRTVSGHYWNLIKLKVNDDFSPIVREYVYN